jgi:hypothetical protein
VTIADPAAFINQIQAILNAIAVAPGCYFCLKILLCAKIATAEQAGIGGR